MSFRFLFYTSILRTFNNLQANVRMSDSFTLILHLTPEAESGWPSLRKNDLGTPHSLHARRSPTPHVDSFAEVMYYTIQCPLLTIGRLWQPHLRPKENIGLQAEYSLRCSEHDNDDEPYSR